MTYLKARILDLLSERDFTLSELARLLKTDENHLLHLLFRLQEDKHPIIIEKGYIYIDKGHNPWAILSGVLAMAICGLIFMFGGW